MYAALNRTLLNSGGLRPALALDFLNEYVDSRLTTSGGANGTRVNSSGVIVAATTPRFDYDPVTLAAKGLLIEEARTNLLLNSVLAGTSLSTQSVTVTAAAHTLSFYGTGTVTLSGVSTAGPLVGSGAYPTRSTLTFTPTAGSLTLTVTGTVQFAQLEVGSFASSFIATAGSAVTRTADSVTMTGANFSDWFNASAGTWLIEATPKGATTYAVNQVLLSADDGTASNRHQLYRAGPGGAYAWLMQSTTNGNFWNPSSVGAWAQDAIGKIAMAYAASDQAAVAAGTVTDASAVANTMGAITTLHLGSRFDGAIPFNGHVRSLRYYSTRLPNATLQALTS